MVRLFPRRAGIGVIEIRGIIGAHLQASVYHELLDRLERDPKVGAVLMDIDSPGGAVGASEDLYLKARRLSEKKPVVAFIRGSGTSGAYLLACAATRIIALPSAIVGSIGVISMRPEASGLLDRLGVGFSVSKSGPLKDMGAFYRPPTDDERAKLQTLIDELFKAFLEQVAESRKMDLDEARKYATGEVFTARSAVATKLIDETGDFDKALDTAAELGKVPRRMKYLRPPKTFRQRMLGQFAVWSLEAALDGTEVANVPKLWYL